MKSVDLNFRSFFVLFLSLLMTATVYGVTPKEREALTAFLRASGVNPGSVAIKITDLSDGRVMSSHNTTKPLIPASIMKSVTTAALLRVCGSDYRYKTKVYTDGPFDMGILRGNLIVEGVCDPSLNSTVEPYGTDIVQEIVETLKEMGVNKIEGMIIIDESQFAGAPRPDSWQPADFSQSYGTGSHAFNFENNANGRRSVENPQNLFMSRLKNSLRSAGILVDGKDLGEGERQMIFVHLSPTIDDIMRSCMMRSDNLFAESMLRTYSKLAAGDGSTEDGASREYAMWEKRGMPLDGVTIIDGSGLSRNNRVTADFMTNVLATMAENEIYASFFPLAGQEGTLKSFLVDTPLEGYIAMKTGSMKGIQCYAGYLLDDDYVPTHTVVIIMNDLHGSRNRAKKAAQTMLLEIFDKQISESPQEVMEEAAEEIYIE